MAYEVCEPNITCFSVRFATSQNLVTWQPIGNLIKKKEYTACPTIRFLDGQYYVFYLRIVKGKFATYVSRTSDFINFTESPIPVIEPLLKDEGINTSDMDLVETGDKIIFNYAVGNQASVPLGWAHIKLAHFNGSLSEFVKKFFYF